MEDFFRNPEKTAFKISPDGQYLAFLMPWRHLATSGHGASRDSSQGGSFFHYHKHHRWVIFGLA
jgi:hypothetical protein